MRTCLSLSILLLLTLGCGDVGLDHYAVSGTVFYNGQSLPTGNVMFIPESGPAIATKIEADGSYSLLTTSGRHQVIVAALQPPPAGINEKSFTPPPPLVPSKFGRAETSGIVVVVEPRDNKVDLELK